VLLLLLLQAVLLLCVAAAAAATAACRKVSSPRGSRKGAVFSCRAATRHEKGGSSTTRVNEVYASTPRAHFGLLQGHAIH
jgi:hypothetical protein